MIHPSLARSAQAAEPTRGTRLAFVTASGCMPCVLLKPIVRKVALEFSAYLTLIEVDGDRDHGFRVRHQIDRYPQLLLLKDDALKARMTGFHEAPATRVWLVEALEGHLQEDHIAEIPEGQPTAMWPAAMRQDLARADEAFAAALEHADAAVQAIMQAARDDLDPFMIAIAPEIAALETRLADQLATGALTQTEAARLRRMEQARLQAPFQGRIAALGVAQAEALALYESMSEAGLNAYEQAVTATRRRLACSADGLTCHVITL